MTCGSFVDFIEIQFITWAPRTPGGSMDRFPLLSLVLALRVFELMPE